jgi:hypothetical protein
MACGILELFLLNEQMGMVGILVDSELRFYTRTIVYSVGFGPSGAYGMEKFNRFVNDWQSVMFSGTLEQTTNTLNQFGPFIGLDEVMEYWGGLTIPPPPPITNFGPIFYPV